MRSILLVLCLMVQLAYGQPADKFPSKQVTIIVGFAPGGGGDISSRWIADHLHKRWNVPVIVENKPGAGATIAASLLAHAAPDGYTTYVPYKGGADAMNGLLGGQIQALVAAEFPPYAAAGTIRLLAESGPDTIPDYPDVPTYKSLNFPVSVPIFYGIAGPAGLSADVISTWETTGAAMVSSLEFKALAANLKNTAAFLSHDDFTALITGVYRQMGQLIPKLNLRKD